ncbi:MAG: LON peptidase substrate-binding domain-containing protein [Saprospiraceae bacterium]|nr:LON peptidase substrate-binding domain-containing protein [Saprospiraceae bacterium]
MIYIPLFPLSLVVFPGEELRLHIFEPRYKQLIHDCVNNNSTFGIPPYFEGKDLVYGTELKITKIVKKYDDGKMDIKALGIGWFEIVEFYKIMHGKLYPGGQISRMPWDDTMDLVDALKLRSLIEELYSIMKINNIKIEEIPTFRSFQLAHKLGLNIEQELKLLAISAEKDRQLFLINHLENLIPIVLEAEKLRKRAELNGHFQNIKPPNF